jgi:hypothetical protein
MVVAFFDKLFVSESSVVCAVFWANKVPDISKKKNNSVKVFCCIASF